MLLLSSLSLLFSQYATVRGRGAVCVLGEWKGGDRSGVGNHSGGEAWSNVDHSLLINYDVMFSSVMLRDRE